MLDHRPTPRTTRGRRMDALGVDLVFLPPSADLEYLTGFKRRVLTFGNIEYAHSWVTGCFFGSGPGAGLRAAPDGHGFRPAGRRSPATSAIVNELDDGEAIFQRVARVFRAGAEIGRGRQGLERYDDQAAADLRWCRSRQCRPTPQPDASGQIEGGTGGRWPRRAGWSTR